MNYFDVLVDIASIGSFVVALIALFKVVKIEKYIIKDDSNKTIQTIEKTQIKDSDVRQIGRDSKGD